MLEDGIHALEHAGRRRLTVGEQQPLEVELFHNPARLASAVARPTADARCPLCAANVPPEEQGIPVGANLVALPNPAPIVRNHVVLAHREHVPQSLRPCLEDLAALLAASDNDTAFLYNGPTSGASSPYHLHLQAGRAQDLPLTTHKSMRTHPPRTLPWGSVAGTEAGGRRFLLLTVTRPSHVAGALTWALDILGRDGEFPLNLVLWRRGFAAIGALFPRGRHRPSCFFLPEERRVVVSPGSVEMAGLVVLPRRQDWEGLDPLTLQEIYREVSIDDDAWRSLLLRLAG
jgi:hypothetical protein